MVQSCVAIVALVALVAMSLRANRQLARASRLPMQWSITGAVNWTAPRPLALAFTPALAAIVLTATTIATMTLAPRPGQEGMEIPVVLIMSLGFIAIHALHLRLMAKSVNG